MYFLLCIYLDSNKILQNKKVAHVTSWYSTLTVVNCIDFQLQQNNKFNDVGYI